MFKSIKMIPYPDPVKSCEWFVLCCLEQNKTYVPGSKASLRIELCGSSRASTCYARDAFLLLLRVLVQLRWGPGGASARRQDAGSNGGRSAWLWTQLLVVPLVEYGRRRAVRVPLRTCKNGHRG